MATDAAGEVEDASVAADSSSWDALLLLDKGSSLGLSSAATSPVVDSSVEVDVAPEICSEWSAAKSGLVFEKRDEDDVASSVGFASIFP